MNLFFDLDGTIIDVKKRHLKVFHSVVKKLSLSSIPNELYWDRKRNKLPLWNTLSHDTLTMFQNSFKEESELSEYLSLDTVADGMYETLVTLKKTYPLVLLTRRHNRNNLLKQLETLSLLPLFAEIITSQKKERDVIEYGYGTDDIIIGDTEEDILTAKNLNLTSVAVTWGLRTREYLTQFSPTHIVDNVEELREIL